MKALVTGASGFVGKSLCAALTRRGINVTPLSSRLCDLRNMSELSSFTERYDLIFHLAAWTQAGDFCLHHPGEQWINNQAINTNVLTWWHRYQSQAKLVSAGTSCSYDPELELSETNYLLGTPIESLYTYAMTKRMLQIGQVSLARQFGLRYLTAVPSTLYGPGYHTDGRQLHFIFDLIRKILRGKLLGERVVLWGDGSQRRELVYLEDFTEILLQLTSSVDNDVVNIGAGEDYQIRDFAEMISNYLGYDHSLIEYDTSRYVGARAKCLSVKKLRALQPGLQMTPIAKGLPQTIDWFRREWSAAEAPQLDSR